MHSNMPSSNVRECGKMYVTLLKILCWAYLLVFKTSNCFSSERISCAHHYNGYYRCFAQTASYTLTSPGDGATLAEWMGMFRKALSRFATNHAALCCGILGEEGQHPHFVRLPHLDLDRVLTSHIIPSTKMGSEDEVIRPFLEDVHSTKWDRIWENPGWKATVIWSELASQSVWVVFAAHHALMDGLSGCVFHRELLAAMSLVDCHSHVPTQLPIPLDLNMSPPIEDLLKIPTTWGFWLNQIWHTYKPSCWTKLWPSQVSQVQGSIIIITLSLTTIYTNSW